MTNPISRRLSEIAQQAKSSGLRDTFSSNPNRAEQYTYSMNGLTLDLSKTHISDEMLESYAQMAEEVGLAEKRHAMFSGEPINLTEDRAVLHSMLRESEPQQIGVSKQHLSIEAKTAKQNLMDMVEQVQRRLNSDSESITDLIHVGIGGSALGPQLLFEALKSLDSKIKIHFIGNIDGHQIASVLSECNPVTSLIFGVSKTYTTEETLTNLLTLKAWCEDGLRDQKSSSGSFESRFYAITANASNALQFGVNAQNLLVFPEWVGGRYSVWSGVSLAVVAVLGWDKFNQLLEGAEAIDREFLKYGLKENPAFVLAALDHFYVNHFNAGSRATFAYDFRLRSLVPYLQQLEMESNGKDRDLNGDPVCTPTAPVIWGGVGTDMQHSTFQFLHQGTHFVPIELIVVKKADHSFSVHHRKLLSNAIGQSAALLEGRSEAQLSDSLDNTQPLDATQRSRLFSGNRPSSTFVIDELSARHFGSLIALYEQRTFCFGVLSKINSFDQMGVELGKQLASQIEPLMSGGAGIEEFDGSTLNLLSACSNT